jgi:hypothetical protein
VFVDLIVKFGEAQLRTGYFLEDLPVCLDVLDDCALPLAVRESNHVRSATFHSERLLDL